ncbi:hypothetical protein [Brachyspira hyodysenteriae]|uniref:hypothetical protein n=1 Tax=Brachyspira hyodysenteriae TaxID=159 RepID=UPI0022CDB753|nr:hypothetical protein [Brachyspira hyodysenteriae]MCZ9971000.1 hypothetical protein [Brachyspira hyodysenteriae]MCZ9976713.1 hypothetical protein [Brachyspira hyodysenteriae]MDA0010666.1 hypothetical protein [Brachyspira hyodysenteriae]MDA0019226.1 hypothetical protein [Brachyspira hyodysenteriae]MDA0027629.1 hypothetical protein [Brachyspira hyodysenteriae]
MQKDFDNLNESAIHIEGKTKDGKEVKTKEKKLNLCEDCILEIAKSGLPVEIRFED